MEVPRLTSKYSQKLNKCLFSTIKFHTSDQGAPPFREDWRPHIHFLEVIYLFFTFVMNLFNVCFLLVKQNLTGYIYLPCF